MEIELKLRLLDRGEMAAVAAKLLPRERELSQHSLYFDDPGGVWRRHEMAVRLRRQSGELWLTVKTAGESAGDFVVRGEWESNISESRWDELREGGPALRQEVSKLLSPPDGPGLREELATTDLVAVGAMDNLRHMHPLPGEGPALLVELDETTYPNGQVTYEVELEVPETIDAASAEARLRVAFEAAGIDWRPSSESKRACLERVLRGESL